MRSAFGQRPSGSRSLYDYIAADSGTAVAGAYIDRIEAACLALKTFPERDIRRDDIRMGLRTIGFERRAMIAFQIVEAEVVILRIRYGGRDLDHALSGASSD